MSGWDGVPLPPYFAELTDAPVILDNDANVIALAERRGDRQAFDDLLVIKASTGLGAGIIAGGVLQRGAVQAAGEFGHNKTPRRRLACRAGAGISAVSRRSPVVGPWCVNSRRVAVLSVTCATSWSWPTAATPTRVA